MQMSVGRGGTELNRVTEEFNEMFGGESNQLSWHWFLPIPIEFPNGMKKVVLGYEWDESFDLVPYQDPNDRDVESGSNSVHSSASNRSTPTSTPRIELTTVPPTSSSSRSSNKAAEGDTFSDELRSSSELRPKSKKLVRRSSRDYDKDADPLRPSGGTMS